MIELGKRIMFCCCLLAPAPASMAASTLGTGAAQTPFELVHKLMTLQDQTAYGDKDAYEAAKRLSASLAARFATADDAVWTKPKNARAALVYILSGGDQRFIRVLLGSGIKFGVGESLLKGVLAYRAGRYRRAAALFATVDVQELNASIAPHVALVQSVLMAKRDPAHATALLDFARLMAPGTLVEEAALRRQVFLIASTGDFAVMEKLASQYLRRFPRSLFADGFMRKLVSVMSSGPYQGNPERYRGLAAILSHLGSGARRRAYLSIAGDAVISGRLKMARFAAQKAARLAKPGSPAEARAKLYSAAALVVTDDFETALAALKSIDRSALGPRNRDLLKAATLLAGEVRRVPKQTPGLAAGPPAPVVQRAKDAIANVDKILGGPDR